MISLKPILFFSLIELLIALAVGASILFWKWQRLKKERQAMVKLWREARDLTEANLAELEHQRETGGYIIAHKMECLAALKAMFDQELMTGLGQWGRLSEAILVAFGMMEQESEDSKAQKLAPELNYEFAQPEMNDYQEIESLIDEQKDRLIELQQYKSKLADLISKIHHINAANDKLDGLKNLASTNENPQVLLEILDTFQQYKQEMQWMIALLEHESNQIEPKVKALEVQNRQLLASLNSYRTKTGNADRVKRIKLTDETNELKKKLAMRDISISRMYDKYEALRREYIKLYDFSTKGNKPKFQPPV